MLTGHDTLATAIPETLVQGIASTIPGTIDEATNTADIYQVNLSFGQRLSANVDVQSLGSSLNSYLRVFSTTGTELANSGNGSGNSAANYTAFATGAYYVGVSDAFNTGYDPNISGSGSGATSGQYNLTLLVNPPVSDPNNTIANATTVSFVHAVSISEQGLIFDPRDADLFKLTLNQFDAAKLSVNAIAAGSTLESRVRVFDANGNELASNHNPGGDPSFTYEATSTGVYYVGISGNGNDSYDPHVPRSGVDASVGSFALQVQVNSPDPNNRLATATPVNFIRGISTGVSGQIVDPPDADIFSLALNTGDTAQLGIAALTSGSPLESRLRLFDATGNELASNATPGSDPSLTYQATAAGIYYVGVSGTANAAYDPHVPRSGVDASVGSFQLNVTVNSPPPVTQEVEPNDTLDDANSIAVGASVGGSIGTVGDQDFYLFTLTAPGQLTVGAAPDSLSSLAPRLTLYGSDRQPLLTSVGQSGGEASIQQHLPAGTYYVSVASSASTGATDTGAYHISTSFIAATPPFAEVPANQVPIAVATADFNGDGIPDLVVVNGQVPYSVTVLLGVGDGTFRPAVSYPIDVSPFDQPTAVVVGDFNNDGHPDIAVTNVINGSAGEVSVLLNNGDGTFQAPLTVPVGPVGGQPLALAVGHFNADANLDLAVAVADPNGGPGSVVVLSGNGNGSFTTGETIPVGVRPDAIVAASFGNDPFTDLAVANRNTDQNDTQLGSGSVSLLHGNGDGTFGSAVSIAGYTGDQPTSLAVGDVNGDGLLDLAVANAVTQDVSLLLGNSDGTYQPEKRLDLRHEVAKSISGTFTSAVLLADFNHDGHLDVALADTVEPLVRVALGAGDGTFVTSQPVAVGGQPQALVAGDFAGNGRIGFVAAGGIAGTVSVRLGRGDGTFQVPPRFNVGDQPNGLVAGNFNDDGQLDIAVANDGTPGGVSTLLGLGDGTFQPQIPSASGLSATAIAKADFDGDGRLDLVTANYDTATGQSSLTVLPGNGDGTYQPAVTIQNAGVDFPTAVVAEDFNGDGHPDIAVVSYDLSTGVGHVSILINKGRGAFLPAVEYSVGAAPRGIAAGDFNGDGHLDLAVADSGSNDVSILLGNGNGTFQTVTPATTFAVGSTPVAIAVGDFGNGRLDIATANSGSSGSGGVSILMNQGNAIFAAQVSFAAGNSPIAIVAGHFHGANNPLDLAVANNLGGDVSVLVGLGGSAFATPVSYAVGQSPTALIAADLNGDGRVDLVCANGFDRDVSVLLGTDNGTFVSADKFRFNAIASTPTLADVTGDGTPDSIVLNQNGQILVRPGRGAEPGAFDAARIVNPGHPARAFTIVKSAGKQLIAAVDLTSNSVSLYSTDASGVSTFVETLQTDSQPVRIAAADLTGDGRQDLVVADAGSGKVSIFLATANGDFAALAPLQATDHPTELTLIDLNGDGLPEIVLTDDFAGTVTVLVNQGGGAFAPAIHYRAATGQAGFDLNAAGFPTLLSRDGAGSMAWGDFTENGTTDLVVVNPGDASLSLLEGNGRGGFLNPVRILAGIRPAIVRVGHFFSDGHLDLAVLDADNHTITILRGDGHGNFQPAGQYDAGNQPNDLTIGDFDRNGIADLNVGNTFGDVLTLTGNPNGDGTFLPYTRIGKRIAIAVGDVTGNGQQSWVVTDQTTDRLVVQVGGTTPGFTQDRSNGIMSPGAVKIADLNGDGIPDMIVVNGGGNDVLVYLGLGHGQFAAPIPFYAGTDPVDVQVANADGNPNHLPDLIITNQGSNDVSILLNETPPAALNPQHLLVIKPGPRRDVGLAPVSTQVGNFQGTPGQLLVTNSGSNQVSLLTPTALGGYTTLPFNTGDTPQAAIVGNFFGGAGLDLVTLNYSSNTLTVFRNFDPGSRQDIGSGGVGPITAIAGDFAQNGGTELVVGNSADGALAIFTGTANGLVESDAIFSENLQHPVALALAAPGEGQELRLLAADEGDENVRVFTRESVLQPAKLADNDLSSSGLPGFSLGFGNFAMLFGALGAAVESGIGDLFVGIELGMNSGGASMNFPSLRDFSVENLAAAVSRGTKWLESAVHTIAISAGLHNVPDGALDFLESVLDAATPQVPWQVLHQFFNSLLHASAPNQKGPQKPAVVDQVFETSGADRPGESAVESQLFGDDSTATDGSDNAADLLVDILREAVDGASTLQLPDDMLIRQQLFGSATDCQFEDWPSLSQNSARGWDLKDRLSPPPNSHDQSTNSPAVEPTAPIGSARSDDKPTEQKSPRSDWRLAGAIAATLACGPGLARDRDRMNGGPIAKNRNRLKSPGGGHAKRD